MPFLFKNIILCHSLHGMNCNFLIRKKKNNPYGLPRERTANEIHRPSLGLLRQLQSGWLSFPGFQHCYLLATDSKHINLKPGKAKHQQPTSFCSSFPIDHQNLIPLLFDTEVRLIQFCRAHTRMLSAVDANTVRYLNKCTCLMSRNVERIWNVP